jgi:sterol desaturase/sphingolipid hydroxylase (fatty acid hydroxylase superfamily)
VNLHRRLLAGARACGAVALARFTRQPSSPWLPIAIYGTAAAGFVLWNLLTEPPAAWVWIVLPTSGLFLWTLVEYLLHSQMFHDAPPLFRWVAASHGNHHDEPNDPNRIVARLTFSLPAAAILFGALSLVLWSPRWAGLVVVGLVAGYLAYEVIHFSIHRVPWVRRLLRPLASHHLHHHYADPSRCFGVTSPLWDWVFRTGRRHRVIVTDIVEPEVSSRPGDAVIGG